MGKILGKTTDADGLLLDEQVLEQLAFNEKMAELGKLSAGLVHELNSPLSVIVSASQMILREEDLPEFVKEMVERIGTEAQRLSLFTRSLLSFARNDAETDPEADVNLVLQEVMDFLRYEARKNSITVIEEKDFDLPPIAADANKLKQVFINLIMNAFQAMEEGGTLLLKTAAAGDRLAVDIADTGKGIPSEKIDLIFEPFYSTKAAGEGTGLGLYIARNILERLGGSISVRSIVNEGTTFTLLFPLP
ncbi:ATP-binding protein [Geotalea sp. SG265]|uniref:sensor histidine kinase n=1 Tax=Geotalea sp. SG265 TaxID=2922867 RepID=UPI001FAF2C63|nr:ATP-binding protein [Geotalea sp. SG265]